MIVTLIEFVPCNVFPLLNLHNQRFESKQFLNYYSKHDPWQLLQLGKKNSDHPFYLCKVFHK